MEFTKYLDYFRNKTFILAIRIKESIAYNWKNNLTDLFTFTFIRNLENDQTEPSGDTNSVNQ